MNDSLFPPETNGWHFFFLNMFLAFLWMMWVYFPFWPKTMLEFIATFGWVAPSCPSPKKWKQWALMLRQWTKLSKALCCWFEYLCYKVYTNDKNGLLTCKQKNVLLCPINIRKKEILIVCAVSDDRMKMWQGWGSLCRVVWFVKGLKGGKKSKNGLSDVDSGMDLMTWLREWLRLY